MIARIPPEPFIGFAIAIPLVFGLFCLLSVIAGDGWRWWE